MKGRLEHNIRVEAQINEMLSEMPEFMNDYYITFKQGRQPKACYEYLTKLRKFLRFVNEDIMKIKISDLDSISLISNYMDEIATTVKNGEKAETSLAYRQQIYSILNSFYNYLDDNDLIKSNPMKKIKRVKGKDCVERVFLTESDLKDILLAVEHGAGTIQQIHTQEKWKSRDKAIMMLFMETGIRVTALCEINVDDIDFEKNTIQVVNKGYKPYIYKFEFSLKLALQEWIEDRKEFIGDIQTDALFISKTRKRLTPMGIRELVGKYSYEALGYSISPHKLRAAFANMVLRNTNGNIYLAQRLLDHESPATTKIYLQDITEEDKEKTTEMISNLIF